MSPLLNSGLAQGLALSLAVSEFALLKSLPPTSRSPETTLRRLYWGRLSAVEEDKERETQERDQTEVRPSQSLQPTRWPHEEAQPTLQEADTSVPAEPCLTGPGNLKGVAYYAAIKK